MIKDVYELMAYAQQVEAMNFRKRLVANTLRTMETLLRKGVPHGTADSP